MVSAALIVLTTLLAAVHARVAVQVAGSVRQLTVLAAVPTGDAPTPRLSLITPARDEAAVIEASLRSALAADDPHIEFVAIDDRSSDDTGGVPPQARVLAVVGAVLHSGASVHFNRWVHRPVGSALLPQVGLLLCACQLLRAAWIGHRIGGIEWRGRLYRSHELKPMQRVRL